MADAVAIIDNLLSLAVDNGASDIHVKSHQAASLRLNGRLEQVEMDAIPANGVYEFVEMTCPKVFLERWKRDGQIDYGYQLEGAGRFRVAAFHQRGTPSIVFRYVKERPPTFEELRHQPDVLKRLCTARDGIVLVCGPTGSGKSSTMAAMLEWINQTMDRHIITLEDPIEFNYTDDRSIFNQREVGIDTPTFAAGIRGALRQDPDIILVGEMRDRDTFETAIAASETGHLVFATLHSANAQQAIQRLFEFFPPELQIAMRHQIASTLRATLTQRLVPCLDGGRVPAVEVFVADSMGRKVIEEGTFEKIPSVMEAGKEAGSQTFNADLYRLVKDGTISRTEAMNASPNAKALDMNLKGIFLSTGGLVN